MIGGIIASIIFHVQLASNENVTQDGGTSAPVWFAFGFISFVFGTVVGTWTIDWFLEKFEPNHVESEMTTPMILMAMPFGIGLSVIVYYLLKWMHKKTKGLK